MKRTTLSNTILFIFIFLTTLFVFYGIYLDYMSAPYSNDHLWKVTCSAIASLSGVLFIYLEIKERYLMFHIGIIYSTASIVYLYLWSPLLWDLAIQIVYLILTVYGLYYWKHPEKQQEGTNHTILSRNLTKKEYYCYISITLLIIAALSYIGNAIGRYHSLLQNITDATTTASAIIAQWFLSKKILQTWHLWILVNTLSVPLYISIDSYAYAFLYASFIPLTWYGLWSWKSTMIQEGQ